MTAFNFPVVAPRSPWSQLRPESHSIQVAQVTLEDVLDYCRRHVVIEQLTFNFVEDVIVLPAHHKLERVGFGGILKRSIGQGMLSGC